MRQCPSCAEPIRDEAIKCRWCHEMVTAEQGDPVALDLQSPPPTPVSRPRPQRDPAHRMSSPRLSRGKLAAIVGGIALLIFIVQASADSDERGQAEVAQQDKAHSSFDYEVCRSYMAEWFMGVYRHQAFGDAAAAVQNAIPSQYARLVVSSISKVQYVSVNAGTLPELQLVIDQQTKALCMNDDFRNAWAETL